MLRSARSCSPLRRKATSAVGGRHWVPRSCSCQDFSFPKIGATSNRLRRTSWSPTGSASVRSHSITDFPPGAGRRDLVAVEVARRCGLQPPASPRQAPPPPLPAASGCTHECLLCISRLVFNTQLPATVLVPPSALPQLSPPMGLRVGTLVRQDLDSTRLVDSAFPSRVIGNRARIGQSTNPLAVILGGPPPRRTLITRWGASRARTTLSESWGNQRWNSPSASR